MRVRAHYISYIKRTVVAGSLLSPRRTGQWPIIKVSHVYYAQEQLAFAMRGGRLVARDSKVRCLAEIQVP